MEGIKLWLILNYLKLLLSLGKNKKYFKNWTEYFFSLNECAFICYQNACSNVLFELGPGGEESTEGSGVRLSKCHLDIESNTEKCSGNLQRHYSYPNINMTLMSCVRCGKFFQIN